MKYEWKKLEKNIYGAKQKAEVIEVPNQKFIMISGRGNPNMEDFSNRVSALYSLAYGIKMLYKSIMKDEDDKKFTDFTVFPLEGIWQEWEEDRSDKSKLKYNIMIKQSEFITDEIFLKVLDIVKKKKPNVLYDEIAFDEIKGGKSIQILHIGSYDDEPQSFIKMDELASKANLSRISNSHREIYLNNKNRTAEEKLKTILRYDVK